MNDHPRFRIGHYNDPFASMILKTHLTFLAVADI